MLKFKNISIRYKIIFPALLLIVIPVITFLLIIQNKLNNQLDKEIDISANDRLNSIRIIFNQLSQRDVQLATFAAAYPPVQEAYDKLYSDTVDFKASSEIIKNSLNKILNFIFRQYNSKVRLTFYLSKSEVFYQSWNEESLKEVKITKPSILSVNKNHQIESGLDFDPEGFIYSTVIPIYSLKNRRFYGCVEVKNLFKDIFTIIKSRQNEDMAIYLSYSTFKSYKNIYQLKTDTSKVVENFLRFESTSEEFSPPKEFLNYLNQHLDINQTYAPFQKGNLFYAAFPLADINHNFIGVAIYRLNISEYTDELKNIRRVNYLLTIFFVLLGILLMIYISQLIVKPLHQTHQHLINLSNGYLPDNIDIKGMDEIGIMLDSINKLVDNLKEKSKFAKEIGMGNYISNFQPVSENDILGISLIEMRESLIKAQDEHLKRQFEDEKQDWAAEGRAKFADVIRKSSSSIFELSDNILKSIVEYMKANQGGLFILKDSNPNDIYLSLIATYAYERKKHLSKKIRIGEGLVGMCALEKYTIYRTQLPDDYIKIRSGLGFGTPKCLLIVPLKIDNKLHGIIELASFKEYEPHEIHFLETISENIASAIANVKVNEKTIQLLEQSRKQTEELEIRESEIKQTVELMRSAQEEAIQREQKAVGFVNAVNNSIIRADFNLDGTFESTNDLFLETLRYLPDEIKGKHVTIILHGINRDKFENIWNRLSHGGNYYIDELRFRARAERLWFLSIFAPIKDTYGTVRKIILLGINIDTVMNGLLIHSELFKSVYKCAFISEYRPDGTLIGHNDAYLSFTGFSKFEIQNKNLFEVLQGLEEQKLRLIWDSVLDGSPMTYIERVDTKDGATKYLKGFFSAVNDVDNNIEKVIFISFDVTDFMKVLV